MLRRLPEPAKDLLRSLANPRGAMLARKIRKRKADRLARNDVYQPEPRVSLMIQSFNHRDHVPDIVAGLRRTAAEEIIVCEDGSIDGSLQAWTDLLDRPNDFVVRSNDLHELRAYDRAMTLARGEIVCLLQDDDIPPEDTSWYDHSVALFERYPKLVMIGGCIGFSGLETCTAISDEHPYAPGDITSVYGETPDYATEDGIPFMFVEGINVGPVFIRKKPFLEIGGFDMSYSPVGWPAIHFDIEMSLRVWREGGQVGWFPMPFAQRGMPGTKSFGHLQKRLDQLQRNAAKLHESFDDLLPTISEQVARANATLVQRK